MRFRIGVVVVLFVSIAAACGSDAVSPASGGEQTPVVTSVTETASTPTPLPPIRAFRATPVFDNFPSEPFALLDVRRIPDMLIAPGEAGSDEINRAWINYLSDTELLNQTIVSLVVLCGDGTGRMTGVIPDRPEFAKYRDTNFEWDIVRSAAQAGSDVSLNLRFDPPLDVELWDALDTPISQFGVKETHLWQKRLTIVDEAVQHGLTNEWDDFGSRTGGENPLAIAIETDRCS